MLKRFAQIALLGSALVATATPRVFAQAAATLGTIEGIVKDATGGALPGATVTLRNTQTGFTRTVVTESNGAFRAPLLPIGPYSMTVEMAGFKTLHREGLILTIGATVSLGDVTLEVSTLQETITVTAESPVVETSRTVVAATFEDKAIRNLPINGRDFQDFALLTPTVVRVRGRDTLSMGGQRGINTNITLDGADFNNPFFGQATGQPESRQYVISQEAVREFQVLANGYSAEFGRSSGGVLNVITKSGTNEFSGSGFIFTRSESLASTLETVDGRTIPKTDFSQQQFGGSVGGPIRRDKAHYFVSVEQQFFDVPFTVRFNRDVSGVPTMTQLFRQQISGVDRIADLEGTFRREVNLTAMLAKVDFQLNSSNSLTLRYNFSRFEGIQFGATAGGVEGLVQSSSADNTENTKPTSHSFVASNTTVIGNNKFNEIRFQYAFESRPREGVSNNIPEIDIVGCCKWGRLNFLPITSEHPRIQISDNFTYLFGNHDMKLGVDLNFTNTKQGFFGFSGGRYIFNSLEDFIAGRPREFRQLVGLNGFTTVESGTIDFGQQEYAFYVQDVWKPKPNLTLNFGLRWEGMRNPEVPAEDFGKSTRNPRNPGDIFGLDQQDINDDMNNWAPRVGFAWDISGEGKMVLRGGAGIFYSRIPLLLMAGILTNNGFRQATINLTDRNDPAFPVFPFIFPETGVKPGDPLEAKVPTPEIYFWDPAFQVPQTQRANLGLERELAPNFAVGVDYVFAHTIHNQRRRDLNLFNPTQFDALGRGIYQTRTRPDPRFRAFQYNESTANSRYHAVVFSLKRRYSKLDFQTFYTFSSNKSEDDNERSAGGWTASQLENLAADWGYSEIDIRHRWVGSLLYSFPADFNVGVVATIASGNPFNVLSGRDDNGDGAFNDRAVVNDSNRARAQGAGQDLADGLQPRNSARNPNYYNMDLRVTKVFDFGRPGRLELLFELFNVFNNPNRRSSLGRLDLANFGTLNLIDPARQAQLGIRYRW
jgi:hypothetical protein